jgi:conjugative relaxase-like TrwC/TraI family protein
MVTISKPLSATQARDYHKSEFASAEQHYYTQAGEIRGEWHGKLAAEWGLEGAVTEQQFERLAEGQHPESGAQLVRHRIAMEYQNERGEMVKAMEHRAGWDATFSAPKSVSLTALVGQDERVREAHRAAVATALNEMERYTQARIGGNHPAESTGKWIAAKFEHDSARPVNGYSAPQLHTHVVFFNMTQTEDGRVRAVQPQELYRTQQYGTAVYQSELGYRLRELGYQIEAGKNGAPEIQGYSKEYLEASSPRSQQIKQHMAEQGREGAGAAQIAAHTTRDAKQPHNPEEMHRKHRDLAGTFGNQAEGIVEAAKERNQKIETGPHRRPAQAAVTFARERNLERDAVSDERALMRDALKRSMGEARFEDIKAQFEERVSTGEFIQTSLKPGAAARSFTTGEMLELERGNIARMRMGQAQHAPLAGEATMQRLEEKFAHLSSSQRQAVREITQSRDQITGLQGTAGAGKTTSLAAIREAAEREGYRVEGLAPTSRAAQQLGEAGIEAMTLQRHLAQGERGGDGRKRLYFVDESSLASTKQIHDFFGRLKQNDRVVLVGDTRQHQGVEAGRPFEQLQEAGMRTARLDEIVRQKDAALKEVVEQLARGDVRAAVRNLEAQGRVHEIAEPQARLREIARTYAANPESTLVISPDNKSRAEINHLIHRELQTSGQIGEDHRVRVLVSRQEMTGADRQWAAQYESGDVLRYSKGSKATGMNAGEYVRVAAMDHERNLVTVERESGERISYDPRRLQGVTVHKEAQRDFAEGGRVQFTAPSKDLRVANRELGTIEKIGTDGQFEIRMDSGRNVRFHISEHPHLDHGYAVTSHSSQGVTADRVLVNVDTAEASEKLINSRLAYVAVSRARFDAQVFTNDAKELGTQLSREVSNSAAIEPKIEVSNEMTQAAAASQPHQLGQGLGY